MPKIRLLQDCKWGKEGDEMEKSQAWIENFARYIETDFTLVKAEVKIAGNEIKDKDGSILDRNQSKEYAFMRLSEGDKDSIRKGFKEIVLRKNGWVVRDCGNKGLEEIHISIPDRSAQIRQAKDGAIAKMQSEVNILKQFKGILVKAVEGEDIYVTFEDGDKEGVLELIAKLSIGFSEVEVLKAKIEQMSKQMKNDK